MTASRLLYDDVSNDVGYTLDVTSGSTTGYPLSNVLTDRPGNVWRSVGTGTKYLTFTNSAQLVIKAVVIINHNVQTPSGFRVDATNDGVTYTSMTDFTNISYTKYTHNGNRTVATVKYDAFAIVDYNHKIIRIRFNGTTSDAYWQAGRVLLLAADYTLPYDFAPGYQGGLNVVSTVNMSVYGHVTKKHRYQANNFEFTVPASDITQLAILQRIAVEPKFALLPDGITGRLYFANLEIGQPTHVNASYFTYPVTIQELI